MDNGFVIVICWDIGTGLGILICWGIVTGLGGGLDITCLVIVTGLGIVIGTEVVDDISSSIEGFKVDSIPL